MGKAQARSGAPPPDRMRDALVSGRETTMSVLASVAKKLLAPWSAVGLVPPRTDRVDRIVEMPAWAASRLSSGGRLAGRARSSDEITRELTAGRAEFGQKETVEYFVHSSHPHRITIAYVDRRPWRIGSARSASPYSPDWSVW